MAEDDQWSLIGPRLQRLQLAGDLPHGNQRAAFNARDGKFIGLPHIDQMKSLARIEPALHFGCGDFHVHGKSVSDYIAVGPGPGLTPGARLALAQFLFDLGDDSIMAVFRQVFKQAAERHTHHVAMMQAGT